MMTSRQLHREMGTDKHADRQTEFQAQMSGLQKTDTNIPTQELL